MQAQLQDGIDLAACVVFDFFEVVDVPGVKNKGLFTDGVSTRAQGKTHVRVVQVVG